MTFEIHGWMSALEVAFVSGAMAALLIAAQNTIRKHHARAAARNGRQGLE